MSTFICFGCGDEFPVADRVASGNFCRPCKAAYQREWRASTDRSRDRAVNRARGRAMTRLAEAHRSEFEELFSAELGKEGIE